MVFSKKNVSIDGVYEFSDGTKAEFKVKPLTTAEQVALDEMRKTDATIRDSVDFIGCSIRMLMVCEDGLKDRIIDDVYNNSDLVEFREALIGAVMSAKEKK